MEINVPPYQRHPGSYCTCQKEGKPGGTTSPWGVPIDELEKAIKERGEIDSDYAIQLSDIPGIRSAVEEIAQKEKLKKSMLK